MSCARKPVPMDGVVFVKGGVLSFSFDVFTAFYDEFAGLATAKVEMEGNNSIALLRQSSFGKFYQLAVSLLTAHRLALRYNLGDAYDKTGKNDLSTSNVTTSVSASTSSLTESFAETALANSGDAFTADLAKTSYGLELLGLIRNVIPAGEVVSGTPLDFNYPPAQWPTGAGY